MSTKSETKANASVDELQQSFMRKAQQMNDYQIHKQKMVRARNRFSGLFMAAVVGSICKLI